MESRGGECYKGILGFGWGGWGVLGGKGLRGKVGGGFCVRKTKISVFLISVSVSVR